MNNTISKQQMPSASKKAKPASLDRKKARAGWWFVLPFVIGLALVYLPILVNSIWYSFNLISMPKGQFTLTFCGFQNYSDALFTDPQFLQILTASIKQLIFDVPAIVIFALFMAVILNQKMIGRGVFRAIFFIPVIISTGLIESIDSSSLQTYMTEGVDTGNAQQSSAAEIVSSMDVAKLFGSMAVGTELVNYVVGIVNNIFNIVNRSGVQLLVFLAGLQSISPSVYESCQMEGASSWEIFWKITLPMISPMILTNAVYTVIDAFTSESNVVMLNILGEELTLSPDPLQSAKAWLYFAVVALALILVSAICSSFVFYQRRNDN